MPEFIPLYRPDLTSADQQALLDQLERAPFVDGEAVRVWEAGWERQWGRRAVAFAGHDEAVRCLKEILGWRSGDAVGVDPLLDPAWSEALAANWLQAVWRDIDPQTGQACREPVAHPQATAPLRAVVVNHPFGLPALLPDPAWLVIEEISALVQPLPGVGQGAVQLVNGAGPRILPVGTGCLLLSTDEPLIEALLKKRSRPPGAAACALGSALLAAMPARLARRRELAERFLGLRLRGFGKLPDNPVGGRAWELFHLLMRDAEVSTALQAFLHKAGIGCGTPLWYTPRLPEGVVLPGLQACQRHALAIPLYAALSDPEAKKIINRIHRWAERCQ
ncbi:MAG: hypothetical protein H7834_02000 [Magnetococcus sp. YQC-9]